MILNKAGVFVQHLKAAIYTSRATYARRTFKKSLQLNKTLQHSPPLAKYGGWQTVTLIPGDGIGPELANTVQDLFNHVGVPVNFEVLELSGFSDRQQLTDRMEDVLISIQRNGVALKGNLHTPIESPSFKSLNVQLRVKLDLYANVVKCKSFENIKTRHRNVDLVMIRENTEGEYSHLEHENVPGVVESLKIMTEEKCSKIAKFAFEYARKNGRKKVTSIHKANIMKLGDGLFLRCCDEISRDFPDIEYSSMIIDTVNCCMQLVANPEQFDVMVMPNLYGNIVSNIATSLVGGPGMVPGENIGDNYALFESGTRNTGSDLVGKNIYNPFGFLFASTLLLQHIGFKAHASVINKAILRVISAGQHLTPDIGGTSYTTDCLKALRDELDKELPLDVVVYG
ncbi:LOW QUALITY PROTEIN: isocitrate dehydrogenase [NAD] subunit gamma, mitochondrial-like [Dendronephthya gigantea]|uniref:LOW QUALITY PROTEIN: isocitrate dehydrogenase [NAD] subunit gamma, mitochondrial-like n=1 Tax=Dendronephthya gigantea TaxID=151771 RepID=UPI00106AD8D5|nr:LOW QUALITY PROTEIN: isocitrate dehydrogenase [NAD] subunit gamma, mitochondrial-like [Dendronephthya gigantea]